MNNKNIEIIFYDGICGLCHWFVKFTLKRDRQSHFNFSPLQGETLKKTIPAEYQNNIPDSIAVWTETSGLLFKSKAVIYILLKLGGPWKILGSLIHYLPTFFLDFGYDLIAKIRYKIFKRPDITCPIIPQKSRNLFLD